MQVFPSPILVNETLVGQIKVHSTGNVWLEYLGNPAGYSYNLQLDDDTFISDRGWWQRESNESFSRGAGCSTDCEQNYGSESNATIRDLGLALEWNIIREADTVLDFSLLVQSRNWTSEGDANIFQAGNTNLHPDGIAHVFVSTFWDEELQLSYTDFGFEDLLGGGSDKGKNDFVFRLNNTYFSVSEPRMLSLLLVLLGLAGIIYIRRKDKAAINTAGDSLIIAGKRPLGDVATS
jgi:hypothetical protein